MADLPNPAENALAVQDDDDKDAVFEGILDTLQSNNILLGEIDENTESDETASAKRKRRVTEENTDKKGMFSSALGGLGAGIKGVGGVLNKANPFQEGGLGTKMSILLISGVLFAISKFGDKLVKPLAAVLEMFDSEGSVFEKLKETELFKSVIEKFNLIKDYAKNELADDVASLLKAAMTVGSLIKSAYESIFSYISSFDTTGAGPAGQYADGKLDALEMGKLKDNLVEKAGALVTAIIGTIWDQTNKYLLAAFAIGGVASFLIKGYVIRAIAIQAALAAVAKAGIPSAKGPTKRSSRGLRIAKGLGTALAYGVSGSSAALGQKITTLKPGQELNKVKSIVDSKTKRIITPAKNVSYLTKYPRLAKALKIPLLGTIIAGALVASTLKDDTLSKDEKTVAIGGHIGGGLGAAGFGAVGASLGAFFGPPGAIIGGILGSLAGFGMGDKMGQVLAGFLLGKERDTSINTNSLGSELNTLTGTVENLPISKLTSTSSTASQLNGSLMNNNTDLAIAAYNADRNANTSGAEITKLTSTVNAPMAERAEVVSMPVVVDKSEIKTFNSNYSSSLGSNNNYSTVRVLGLEGLF